MFSYPIRRLIDSDRGKDDEILIFLNEIDVKMDGEFEKVLKRASVFPFMPWKAALWTDFSKNSKIPRKFSPQTHLLSTKSSQNRFQRNSPTSTPETTSK